MQLILRREALAPDINIVLTHDEAVKLRTIMSMISTIPAALANDPSPMKLQHPFNRHEVQAFMAEIGVGLNSAGIAYSDQAFGPPQ